MTHPQPSGRQLRLDGIHNNLAAATAGHRLDYKHHAERAIANLAKTGQPFDADDIHRRIPPHITAHHPNVLPSLMHQARRAGLINHIGYRQSTRPSRHSGVIRIWQGSHTQEGDAA